MRLHSRFACWAFLYSLLGRVVHSDYPRPNKQRIQDLRIVRVLAVTTEIGSHQFWTSKKCFFPRRLTRPLRLEFSEKASREFAYEAVNRSFPSDGNRYVFAREVSAEHLITDLQLLSLTLPSLFPNAFDDATPRMF